MKRKSKKAGETTQTPWSFRIDQENAAWLEKESEERDLAKGRIVNNLIADARKAGQEPTLTAMIYGLRVKLREVVDFLRDKGYYTTDEEPDTYTNFKDRQP